MFHSDQLIPCFLAIQHSPNREKKTSRQDLADSFFESWPTVISRYFLTICYECIDVKTVWKNACARRKFGPPFAVSPSVAPNLTVASPPEYFAIRYK